MANPKPKPVASLFIHKTDSEWFISLNKVRMDPRYWTETPLYPASALDEAYRRGQEDMRERAAADCETWADTYREALMSAQGREDKQEARNFEFAAIICEFRAAATRALETKP